MNAINKADESHNHKDIAKNQIVFEIELWNYAAMFQESSFLLDKKRLVGMYGGMRYEAK